MRRVFSHRIYSVVNSNSNSNSNNHINSKDLTNIKTEWCRMEVALKIHVTTNSGSCLPGLSVIITRGLESPFDWSVRPSLGWWPSRAIWDTTFLMVLSIPGCVLTKLLTFSLLSNAHGWYQLLMASSVMWPHVKLFYFAYV